MLNVLVLVLSLTSLAFVATEEPLQSKNVVTFMKDVEECKAAEEPTADDVDILLSFNASLENVTAKGKCFMGCLMERAGFLKDNQIPRADIEELIKKKMKVSDQQVAMSQLEMCEKDLVGVSKDKCVLGPVIVECIRKFDKAMKI